MSWLRSHRRTAWICGVTLLLPLLVYLNAMIGFWGMYLDARSGIERLEPRLARLQGLVDYEDQLRAASAAVDSKVLELVYPATDDQVTVSVALQTNMRDIFGEAGFAVSNRVVLPARAEGNFDYVGVKLTVTGDLPALDEALAGIAAYLPLVLVESLEIYPARAARGQGESEQQLLTANIQLLSLRAAQ